VRTQWPLEHGRQSPPAFTGSGWAKHAPNPFWQWLGKLPMTNAGGARRRVRHRPGNTSSSLTASGRTSESPCGGRLEWQRMVSGGPEQLDGAAVWRRAMHSGHSGVPGNSSIAFFRYEGYQNHSLLPRRYPVHENTTATERVCITPL
jgi:hypothetical protein